MNDYFQTAKKYVFDRRETLIGIAIVVAVVALVAVIIALVRESAPKIVHQPTQACSLFTEAEAKELLGDNVLSNNKDDALVSGDAATSQCSYTDKNPDADNMRVAAIKVRSGINDDGQAQNKADFAASKVNKNIEEVNDLGYSAYYNPEAGQLNVLMGSDWIILSYGVGSTLENRSLDEVKQLAYKVVAPTKVITGSF